MVSAILLLGLFTLHLRVSRADYNIWSGVCSNGFSEMGSEWDWRSTSTDEQGSCGGCSLAESNDYYGGPDPCSQDCRGEYLEYNKWDEGEGFDITIRSSGKKIGICKPHPTSPNGACSEWNYSCSINAWYRCITDYCGPHDGPPPPPPPPPPQPSARVMVVGDSISHGMEGDWTWRWRLYTWLQDKMGYKVSFVGPWQGTHGVPNPPVNAPSPPLLPGEKAPPAPAESPGGYASGVPADFFTTRHASWWGRQAAQSKNTIEDWVSYHQPEYLLILLGFNDLGWWVSGPDELVGDIGQLVEHARRGRRDVKILVGNVVHRTFITGRQDLVDNTNRYNQLLKERITRWFRWESPISYVDVNANYNCRPGGCPDGYDGLHPNAMGEYHIAQAFARTLKADFGFKGPDFVVPSSAEPRTISVPRNVFTSSRNEGLMTSWDRVPGARGYDIRSRVKGATGWWSENQVSTYGSWDTWVINGQTWEFQVRARGDNNDRSDWSASSFATANTATAPGPPNIVAVPTGNGIRFTWGPVVGYNVNRYSVIVWDRDTPGEWTQERSTLDTSLTFDGLKPGKRYSTWVVTWVNMKSSFNGQTIAAGGLPAPGRDVLPGIGAPAPPTNMRVKNLEPTTVELSWTGSANAVGYAIYVRSIRDNTAFKLDGTTLKTTYEVGFLFPGTWNFEFCASAYNGNLESAHTACVVPPVYPGFGKRDEVLPENGTFVATNTSMAYNSTSMFEDDRLPMLLQQLRTQQAENDTFPTIPLTPP